MPESVMAAMEALSEKLSTQLGLSLRLAMSERPLEPAALSETETRIFEGFQSPHRRLSYLLGRAAVHALVPEATLSFPVRGYSLSHSLASEASLAVAVEAKKKGELVPVGIDIEKIAARKPGLARRFLNDREFTLFESLPEPEQETIRFWTIKEAVWKAAQCTEAQSPVVTQVEILSVSETHGLAKFKDQHYRVISEELGLFMMTIAVQDSPF